MVFSIVGRFGLPSQRINYSRHVLRGKSSLPCIEVDVLEAWLQPDGATLHRNRINVS